MATVRYIGPVHPDPPGPDGDQAPGRVRIGHPLYREVAADEAVDVPDEWLEDFVWAPDLWEVEASSDDPRTVPQLRQELKDKGLPTSGTKAELVQRLAEAAQTGTTESGE